MRPKPSATGKNKIEELVIPAQAGIQSLLYSQGLPRCARQSFYFFVIPDLTRDPM
jgi:hypothetical protein